MPRRAVIGDGSERQCSGFTGRTLARVIAACVFARLALTLPGCCGLWSYSALALTIVAAVVASAAVYWAAAAFLAPPSEPVWRPDSRILRVALAVVVGATGAEAMWALGAHSPEPLLARVLETAAFCWVVFCAAMLRRHWCEPRR